MLPLRKHDGLSPSSLALYSACQRKYYLKKIAKADIDPDASEDTEALRVGKALHQVLEDTKHVLDGVTYAAVAATVAAHGLDEGEHTPMIYAMLSRYKVMHAKAGLTALHCEVPIDTPEFYGIVDVVLGDSGGGWWIGDMKTAAGVSQMLLPTLASHPQLSLYAAHKDVLAGSLGLEPEKFKGCRYRLITKSKLIRRKGEEAAAFIARLSGAVKAIDFILPKERLQMHGAFEALLDARLKIQASGDKVEAFPQNYGNCTAYFRFCEYYSRCHGAPASKAGEAIAFVDSE